MFAINQQQMTRNVSVALLFTVGLSGISFADDLSDSQSAQTENSKDDTFTIMDDEAMSTYREQRRDVLVEALAHSKLSADQQELLANAMAKIYVGIPVSSYTHTTRFNSLQDEPIESTVTSTVSVAGHIQQENASYTQNLDADSPFTYFPPAPFLPETGKLLTESTSTAKFVFDFDLPVENDSEDDMLSELSEKMNWVIEITVNKTDHAPELVVIKLEKPVRKRFLFKLTTLSFELHYSFIESCSCFAVSELNTEMKGSAIIVGRMHESSEKIYTNITCEQPLQFLLPENKDSGFLQF